ncbi:MAG: GIY-YIG nuclease family protein [Caldilineaceae bacterium]|nr:GIY-YIG nuclease family protein [Caldilineaceae bacterium]MCB0138776.1 GIY-YIG nuclease family protein [Caldilineaceae bacterium]
MEKPTSAPGSYILTLQSEVNRTIQVGRLGQFRLQPGFYLYVGSALGPGGVAARVAHHGRMSARPHWHIDYLRQHTALINVFCRHDPVRREHEWAQQLSHRDGLTFPLRGFGSSDCTCRSHLFYTPLVPQIGQLLNLL